MPPIPRSKGLSTNMTFISFRSSIQMVRMFEIIGRHRSCISQDSHIRKARIGFGARTDKLRLQAVHAMAQTSIVIGITSGLPPADLPQTPALKTTEVSGLSKSWITIKRANITCKGTAASSTPENVALSSFVNNLAKSSNGLKLYIDYHSYSQLFMTRECPLSPLSL